MSSINYSAQGLCKSFSGVPVLHGIELEIKPGTIYGLFGHNGAGKSTLLKILAGAQPPDSGRLSIGGQLLHLNSPRQALAQGIGCVYQELRLAPNLTVAENLFLGREITRFGFRRMAHMNAQSHRLLAGYGLDMDVTRQVRFLSHPEKQLVEVIANLESQVRFLFLDEPTTALDGRQSMQLLAQVRRIARQRQIGIVLVSHKLDEVLDVCDEASVLAAGRVVYHASGTDIDKQAIIDSVVGDTQGKSVSFTQATYEHEGDIALRVRGLGGRRLKHASLDARHGEVLGLYGLMGSGRTRFLRSLYGMEPVTTGTVELNGKPWLPRSPACAIGQGIAFLTEERKVDGFIPQMSALQNVTLATLKYYRRGGFLHLSRMRTSARRQLDAIGTRGHLDRPITLLSGGNQQKVLLGRIVEQNAGLILLDEPGKGVDIGAKSDIHAMIRQLAREGRCIIVVSSEEEELLGICDRIAVFRHGHCDGQALPVAHWTLATLRQAAWASSPVAA